MKKIRLIAALASVVAIAGCGNEDSPTSQSNQNDGLQTITLQVVSRSSRAGRPLLSSESAQQIDKVKIAVANAAGQVVWTKIIENWQDGGDDGIPASTAYADGRQAVIEIPKSEYELMSGASYTVNCFGYSFDSDFDLSQIENIQVGDIMASTAEITLKKGVGEEIFAGGCQIVGSAAGTQATVTLARQTAATFGYFRKIPYLTDTDGNPGRYLMLVASNPQQKIALGKFATEAPGSKNDLCVANGAAKSENHVIYSIDLLDWFNELSCDQETGLVSAGDNWKGKGDDAVLRYENGSVFDGQFIIPFVKTEGNTFEIRLCSDSEGKTILRTWALSLPSDAKSSQSGSYDLWSWNDNAWTSEKCEDSGKWFSVLRNHLYSVGLKGAEFLPDDPDDPLTPDDPVDLNNKQELDVIVASTYDEIHNLGLE